MNDTTGNRLISTSFVITTAFITWQEISKNKRMPPPKRYVGTAVIMTGLQLVAPFLGPELAGIFAVGFMIGIIYHNQVSAKVDNNITNPLVGQPGGAPTTTTPQQLPGTPPGTFNPLPGGF